MEIFDEHERILMNFQHEGSKNSEFSAKRNTAFVEFRAEKKRVYLGDLENATKRLFTCKISFDTATFQRLGNSNTQRPTPWFSEVKAMSTPSSRSRTISSPDLKSILTCE